MNEDSAYDCCPECLRGQKMDLVTPCIERHTLSDRARLNLGAEGSKMDRDGHTAV